MMEKNARTNVITPPASATGSASMTPMKRSCTAAILSSRREKSESSKPDSFSVSLITYVEEMHVACARRGIDRRRS